MRNRLAAALVAVLTVGTGVGIGAPASQAADPAPTSADEPLRYVHMGDSYAAASGVLPPDPTAHPQCLRSTANFGHVIAEATAARLTDVSCGGAKTKDYFEPQYDGVPPQLDALRKRTELVTMTIGGNNNNTFIGAITTCGTLGASTAHQGSPCKDAEGDSFADDIRNKTKPALIRTLRAVHERSPKAEVAILGYPWILPPEVGCPDKMPVDACQAIDVRWVEPVFQGTNPVVVHPNAFGETEMAAQAMRVLDLI